MRQQRVILALLLSLLISGSCTYVLARKMKLHAGPPAITDLMYAAGAHKLEAGEILKPDSLQLVAWPGAKPLRSAFTKPADLAGRAMLYPMEAGQPILDGDVSAPGAGAGLAARIPEGKRAIALRSDEVAGVAGFLTPGSHVDVLVTYRSSPAADPMTATVLENAQVLTVGQRAQPDPEGKPAPTVTVVTLLLSPEESERAALASTLGMVHFVLRNGADATPRSSTPMLLSMLSGGAATQPPPTPSPVPTPSRARARAAAPPVPGIETVLGNEGGKPVGSPQP